MIERRSGKIVNITTGVAITGADRRMSDYAAAKSGIIGLTASIAKELGYLGYYGININCVSPGPIETPRTMSRRSEEFQEQLKKQTRLGRLGKPEEVANMVLFLVSDEASFITGQTYAVTGAKNLGY